MGSSGGTTEVRIRMQFNTSLYWLRLGSALPAKDFLDYILQVCPNACLEVVPTDNPNVGRSSNSKDEKKHYKTEGFQIIGRDTFHTKQDSS